MRPFVIDVSATKKKLKKEKSLAIASRKKAQEEQSRTGRKTRQTDFAKSKFY